MRHEGAHDRSEHHRKALEVAAARESARLEAERRTRWAGFGALVFLALALVGLGLVLMETLR
jgi:hypothetical protein